ncbi:MAG: ATP-binding protein [Desulfuromonadaceae bacterium]|nr:ATP-binding protein [Desulfuromonadaceae bacterium]
MLHNMTIKRKLTVLLMMTSTITVLLACAVFYVMTAEHLKITYESDLSSLAQMTGNNCSAALAFHIPEDAEHALATLSVKQSITLAVVRDQSGSVFAVFDRNKPDGVGSKNLYNYSELKLDDHLMARYDIAVNGIKTGSITLFDDMSGINQARQVALLMLTVAVAVALCVSYVLASTLQGIISNPILSLSSTAERVTRENNFSLRAPKHANDEIGRSVDAFNSMLSQIEKRDLELSSSEKRFRILVEQAVDSFFLFDLDGTIVDVNQRGCESLGYTFETLLTMSLQDIDNGTIYDLSDKALLKNLKPHSPVSTVGMLRRIDGTTFPVEMRIGLMEISGSLFIMGLARDISERMEAEAEKAKLADQLLQSQKMEAIGLLAGGIAHDFNNMLMVISGWGEMLQAKLGNDDKLQYYVKQILVSSEKSADLVSRLLLFSRKHVTNLRKTDLNVLIREIDKFLCRVIGEDILLSLQLHDEPLPVLLDPGQIDQVLINLCTNARDAMPGGGTLSIRTTAVRLDCSDIVPFTPKKPGMYVLLSVSDAGKGMSREVIQRIFEPFYTTKELGKGTGLGLSIVHGIIKQHNGYVDVYSEPGNGTTFKIYLPLINAVEDKLPEKVVVPLKGTETILVAEDDDNVRLLMKQVLEEHGYRVIEALDGEDAIHKYLSNREEIGLLLLDVIMPKKNGKEVFDAIRTFDPQAKILFASGYTADLISAKGILEDEMDFISKPVKSNDLLTRIRDILDRG